MGLYSGDRRAPRPEQDESQDVISLDDSGALEGVGVGLGAVDVAAAGEGTAKRGPECSAELGSLFCSLGWAMGVQK